MWFNQVDLSTFVDKYGVFGGQAKVVDSDTVTKYLDLFGASTENSQKTEYTYKNELEILTINGKERKIVGRIDKVVVRTNSKGSDIYGAEWDTIQEGKYVTEYELGSYDGIEGFVANLSSDSNNYIDQITRGSDLFGGVTETVTHNIYGIFEGRVYVTESVTTTTSTDIFGARTVNTTQTHNEYRQNVRLKQDPDGKWRELAEGSTETPDKIVKRLCGRLLQ